MSQSELPSAPRPSRWAVPAVITTLTAGGALAAFGPPHALWAGAGVAGAALVVAAGSWLTGRDRRRPAWPAAPLPGCSRHSGGYVAPFDPLDPASPAAPADVAAVAAINCVYDDLREDTRENLAELPSVVHRLSGDARRLREELAGLSAIRHLAGSDEVPDLEVSIAEAASRYSDVVAVLDRIRAALVRLEGHAWNRHSLEVDLADAHELTTRIEWLASSGPDLDSLLRGVPPGGDPSSPTDLPPE